MKERKKYKGEKMSQVNGQGGKEGYPGPTRGRIMLFNAIPASYIKGTADIIAGVTDDGGGDTLKTESNEKQKGYAMT